jgi:hypothetical protein
MFEWLVHGAQTVGRFPGSYQTAVQLSQLCGRGIVLWSHTMERESKSSKLRVNQERHIAHRVQAAQSIQKGDQCACICIFQ